MVFYIDTGRILLDPIITVELFYDKGVQVFTATSSKTMVDIHVSVSGRRLIDFTLNSLKDKGQDFIKEFQSDLDNIQELRCYLRETYNIREKLLKSNFQSSYDDIVFEQVSEEISKQLEKFCKKYNLKLHYH